MKCSVNKDEDKTDDLVYFPVVFIGRVERILYKYHAVHDVLLSFAWKPTGLITGLFVPSR